MPINSLIMEVVNLSADILDTLGKGGLIPGFIVGLHLILLNVLYITRVNNMSCLYEESVGCSQG